jgi:hypothetical protein
VAVNKRFCARCRAEIPAERLEALPDTRLCVACSQAVGGEYEITVVPDNLGMAGSLKKNYAGWTIHKRRRRLDADGA